MIKRYYTNAKDAETFEGADGPFVLYTDYARLESALTLLTNGFKYSTEVVTIARTALAQSETPVDSGVPHDGCRYLAPTGGVCNKCGFVDNSRMNSASETEGGKP